MFSQSSCHRCRQNNDNSVFQLMLKHTKNKQTATLVANLLDLNSVTAKLFIVDWKYCRQVQIVWLKWKIKSQHFQIHCSVILSLPKALGHLWVGIFVPGGKGMEIKHCKPPRYSVGDGRAGGWAAGVIKSSLQRHNSSGDLDGGCWACIHLPMQPHWARG